MRRNIQHSTFNIQRPTAWRGCLRIGCRKLNVECLVFLLIFFSVPPLFAQISTNALPKLAPAYGEIPSTFWELHRTAIIAGSGALVVLAALVLWKLLQPKPPVILPPAIVAREALVQMQRRPEYGNALSEISQILKRYVGAVLGFPAGEMTTAEFSAALAAGGKISPYHTGEIASFLRACDRDKFVAQNVAPPLNAVRRALDFVAQVENEIRRRDAGAPSA